MSNDFFGPAFSLAFVTGGSGVPRDELFALPRACGAACAVLQPGANYRVRQVDASAFGAVYWLECTQAGDCVRIELSTRGVRQPCVPVGSGVTVSATGLGCVLVSGSRAIAFLPNAMGRALLQRESAAA